MIIHFSINAGLGFVYARWTAYYPFSVGFAKHPTIKAIPC
jgi:hypothetical protein